MMFPIVIREDSSVTKQELTQFLEEHNVETREMLPLINQPYVRAVSGDLEADFPVARWINNNGFYIASHQMLTDTQKEYMVSVFQEFFATR